MTKLVEAVLNKNFDLAAVMLEEKFASIMVKLIHEKKKMVAANICEDDIEESIDPTEIYNGPKPKGQRVNSADKGDKQPPNTTVVPKNNLKEEDSNKESPKQILSKRADNYDRTEVPRASNAKAILQTDYGNDSSIGKKAQAAYDSVIAKRDKLEKNAHDARVAQDKDDESSRVKNKLSDAAKGGYITKDAAEKYIYRAKSNIQGGEYAKRRVSQSEPINEEELYEARIKIIKARVRGGKVQRRVKKSNVAGMTLRGGKLTRMSPAERRRRKMGARKAKLKRKSQMGRILMKRKRSMNRRKAMGI